MVVDGVGERGVGGECRSRLLVGCTSRRNNVHSNSSAARAIDGLSINRSQ